MAGELPAAQAPLEGQIQTQIRSIRLIRSAGQTLGSIHDHITGFDSLASADHVLRQILEVAERLATLPERGSHPRELRAGHPRLPADDVQTLLRDRQGRST